MQLEIFMLCDAPDGTCGQAEYRHFDALSALEAPISHPQCAIAGRLRFEEIEGGAHRLNPASRREVPRIND